MIDCTSCERREAKVKLEVQVVGAEAENEVI